MYHLHDRGAPMQALQTCVVLSSAYAMRILDQLDAFLRVSVEKPRPARGRISTLSSRSRIGSVSPQSAKRWSTNWSASISKCR